MRLFVARRTGANLTLVSLEDGVRHNGISEDELRQKYNLGLGDFMDASDDSLVKIQHLPTEVIGDVAYVKDIECDLIRSGKVLVFRSEQFSNALCATSIPLGRYTVRISLLDEPYPLPDGERLQFEGTNAVRVPSPAIRENLIVGSGIGRSPSPLQQLIKGAGFQDPKRNSEPVIGAGFSPSPKPEENVVVGAGFSPSPKPEENVVVGTEHTATAPVVEPKQQAQAPKFAKMTAVVFDIAPTQYVRIFCLWLLDELVEGRYVLGHNVTSDISKGHFFEGVFKEKSPGKWSCTKYLNRVDSRITGGLNDRGKVWFQVRIGEVQPAGTRKRATARADHIGEIVEGWTEATKLTADSEGKFAKIERFCVDNRFVWMVTQISSEPIVAPLIEARTPKHLLVGGRFPRQQKPPAAQVRGAGFAPPLPAIANLRIDKKDDKMVLGSGFNVPKSKQFCAVVLTVQESGKKRAHYLWIIEKKAEGRLVQENCKLDVGHFFKGEFRENKDNKWDCQTYLKGLEPLMKGGLTSLDKIWFQVQLRNFRPAGGNRRFASAEAKHIGEVLEEEGTKLTEACEGKLAKIERKGIEKGVYAWVVTEIL